MTGVAQLVDNRGITPHLAERTGTSPRKRGLKHGLFFFLIGFLVVPLVTIISVGLNAGPFLVVLLAITFFMGSVLRAAYALMFESAEIIEQGSSTSHTDAIQSSFDANSIKAGFLTTPVQSYDPPSVGQWREDVTIEKRPGSVIENTTRLFERKDTDQ
ncbi:MAG: hypothetical protein KF685_04360 [Acidobacteria bacterium]|nr:hypothetical protein [Acidobacteriota bacterium]